MPIVVNLDVMMARRKMGLLCLVMSALFRQAAELKAENDLTI